MNCELNSHQFHPAVLVPFAQKAARVFEGEASQFLELSQKRVQYQIRRTMNLANLLHPLNQACRLLIFPFPLTPFLFSVLKYLSLHWLGMPACGVVLVQASLLEGHHLLPER